MGIYEAIPYASLVQAEILALKRGPTLAASNNINPMEINIDGTEVIHMINKGNNLYHNLLCECMSLLMEI